jgi:hypothetical protein
VKRTLATISTTLVLILPSSIYAAQKKPELDCSFNENKFTLAIGIDKDNRNIYNADTGSRIRSWLAPERGNYYEIVLFENRLLAARGSIDPDWTPVAITIHRRTLAANFIYSNGPSGKGKSVKGQCLKRPELLI